MGQISEFIFSWQMLAGIIIGICIIFLYSLLINKSSLNSVISFFSGLLRQNKADESEKKQEKLAAYQSVKNNLDEMLDTLFSTAKVKKSVSSRLKKSINNGYFSDSEGKEIRSEVMEAHYKYMAFGETLSRTTYSNKQLINDYHNFIYRIIEKIDSATLKSEE